MCELWSGSFLSTSTGGQGFDEADLTPVDEAMGGRVKGSRGIPRVLLFVSNSRPVVDSTPLCQHRSRWRCCLTDPRNIVCLHGYSTQGQDVP